MLDILLLNNLFICFRKLFIYLTELKERPLKEHRCKFKIDKTTV